MAYGSGQQCLARLGSLSGPGMSGADASVLTVMTMQEAVELAGCTVLCDGEEVVIVRRFSGTRVEVASPRFDRYRKVEPGDLEPLPEGKGRPRIDMVASSQAVLNEFVADAVVAAGWDRRQAESALSALCELNWAAGFGFEGDYPHDRVAARGARRESGLPRADAGNLACLRAGRGAPGGLAARGAATGLARRGSPGLPRCARSAGCCQGRCQ
jgi:hypothetical protein